MRRVIGLLPVAALIFAVACGHGRLILLGPPHGFAQLTAPENSFLKECEAALAGLGQKSHTADSLYKYYQGYAVPAHWQRPATIVPSAPRPSRQSYYVIPDVVDSIQASGFGTAAVFHYETDAIFLRANRFCPLVRGMIMAHELVHAGRHMVHGVAAPEEYSRAWRREETVALLTVDTILNEYTNGAWQESIAMALDRRRWQATKNGKELVSSLTDMDATEYRLIATLYPEVPPDQIMFLQTQFLVALNLQKIATEPGPLNLPMATELLELFVGSIYRFPGR